MWLIDWLKGVLLLTVISLLWIRPEPVTAGGLKDFVKDLYGGDGITLAPPTMGFNHQPHFTASSLRGLDALNTVLESSLNQFAFSSTVAAFTFDIERGVPVRTTESLGPLLAERAPTLGAGKLNVQFSYTRFDFKRFDGDDLDDISLTFIHDDGCPGGGDGKLGPPPAFCDFELDTIEVDLDLEIEQDVFSVFATYGVTRTWDVGIVVPIVHVRAHATGSARIIDNSPPPPGPHLFDPAAGGDAPVSTSGGDATGIGDVLLRTKYNFLRNRDGWPDLAIAGQVKLPTGDEDDLLGTGETNFLALLVASKSFGPWSDVRWLTPHVNLGFEVTTGGSEENNLRYATGFDARVHPRLTMAIDFLGRWEPDGDPIGNNVADFAVGMKWNPFDTFLLGGNVLLPLNKDEGLRTDVTWTLFAEYTF
ncbi:MAG: transporter [bacterium]